MQKERVAHSLILITEENQRLFGDDSILVVVFFLFKKQGNAFEGNLSKKCDVCMGFLTTENREIILKQVDYSYSHI